MGESQSAPVRVRFAPSPTGDMHIGGARTALFNWLFARRYGGKFILRIEDTDQKRTQEQSLSGIINGLRWLGLDWDEGPDIGGPFGPYIQSERLELYHKWAQWLVDHDKAYRDYESREDSPDISYAAQPGGVTPGYDRRGRKLTREDWARLDAEGRNYAIRFKMPLEGETTVSDMVRGSITVQNEQMQDLVLLKSDGYPTYHLANVIDDHFMEISHIIRAEEWISTAPVHSQLYTAFGWQMPHIAHVPVILKQSGKGKMSKRDEGASISYFQENGYLPETVTNFLCNVGWNYGLKDENGEEIQIFSKEQAAEIFDITRVSTSGTKFDLVKLQWLNGEYIRRMDVLELAKRLRGPLENAGYEVNLDVLLRVTPLIQERIKTLNEVVEKAGFFFSEEFTTPPATALVPKKMTPEQTANALQKVYDTLINLPDFTTHTLENALRPLTEELSLKPGELFGAIRIAVIGQPVSPPLFESMDIMGRDVCISRIASAIEVLHGAKVQ